MKNQNDDTLYHTKEDIDGIVDTIPGLSSLKGANKIHLVTFDTFGNIKAKALPTDPAFNVVKFKISRKKPVNRDPVEAGDDA